MRRKYPNRDASGDRLQIARDRADFPNAKSGEWY